MEGSSSWSIDSCKSKISNRWTEDLCGDSSDSELCQLVGERLADKVEVRLTIMISFESETHAQDCSFRHSAAGAFIKAVQKNASIFK
jgi:hypothetical protein